MARFLPTNIGLFLLANFLLAFGISLLTTLPVPPIVLGILAIASAIFLIIGR